LLQRVRLRLIGIIHHARELPMSDFSDVLNTVSRLTLAERQQLLLLIQRSSELTPLPTGAVEEPRPAYGAVMNYMTLEEFFEFQDRTPITYEYVNGIIRAMSGPSVAHCLITQNIFSAIRPRLRGGPCEAFCTGGELQLKFGKDQIIYHPDIYVSCDRNAWTERVVVNPKFVVEVLSPSTQHIDRREKLVNYCRLLSLEEYVIVSQRHVELEIYRRDNDWRQEVVDAHGAAAEFHSLDVTVSLADIYDGVPLKDRSEPAR
jgi:Uma2 family endonuclease